MRKATNTRTKKVKILAHRGTHELVPENSLSALSLSAVAGYESVEFDVQMSADQVLVVCHDENLERMTGVNKSLGECTVSELMQLRLKGSTHDTIPLLQDWMAACKRLNIRPQLEIKSALATSGARQDIYRHTMAKKMHAYFRSDPPELERVRVSSFDFRILQLIRAYEPEAELALLVRETDTALIDQLHCIRATACHICRESVTKEIVGKIHAIGCEVLCYTVDTEKQLKRCLATGADGFFTNSTRLMLENC